MRWLHVDCDVGAAALARRRSRLRRSRAARQSAPASGKREPGPADSDRSRRRLRSTTRTRWRRFPATCRWCRATLRSSVSRSSSFTAASARSGRAAAAAAPQAQPGAKPGRGRRYRKARNDIRRIEARGGVTVISKDQNASGDFGVYDLRKKTITLSGNVVVSQGKNVMHGDRVVVDTVTGNAHFESERGGSKPACGALIQPSKGANGSPSNFMTIGPGRQN